MSKIGYARVSTDTQDATGQVARLTDHGCERVFTDTASGKLASRPELDACLAYLRPGDTLVTVKLDRLGRSARHLLEISQRFAAEGIGLVCLDQPIDTTTAMGKMFYTLLAAFAEFERDMISERTRDGLAVARENGHLGGRRPVLKPYQVTYAREQVTGGRSPGDVAAELGVSRASIYRHLSAAAS